MLFSQFLVLVLCMYACYYLLLICFDSFSGRRLVVSRSEVSEFIVAPRIEPVKVVPVSPKYQLDTDPDDEQEISRSDALTEENDEIPSTDYGQHDLGLETISASGGVPVASVKFVDWFKRAN